MCSLLAARVAVRKWRVYKMPNNISVCWNVITPFLHLPVLLCSLDFHHRYDHNHHLLLWKGMCQFFFLFFSSSFSLYFFWSSTIFDFCLCISFNFNALVIFTSSSYSSWFSFLFFCCTTILSSNTLDRFGSVLVFGCHGWWFLLIVHFLLFLVFVLIYTYLILLYLIYI